MVAERVLDELRRISCYPGVEGGGAVEVEIVQTHLSVVALVGDRVYKLKKARHFPFVDFTSLEARRAACREEVRLNRRLCPDVYLGTAALVRDGGGLRFWPVGRDEGDAVIDVAVVMRRLPADRMLDVLLDPRGVTVAEIEDLARRVARFHAEAERGGEVARAGAPHHLVDFAEANFLEIGRIPGHGLSGPLLGALSRVSAADFARLRPRLEARVETHVVDGHGDLHARNVCMISPPAIYDCIEFERSFRCGDVATENAFLIMDLRYRRAAELARAFVGAYVEASGDREQPSLLPPLASYRAMVRAKVSALVASGPELPEEDRRGARGSARRHLLLAAAFALEWRAPLWLLLCGPPASGKSALAAEFAEHFEWPVIGTDRVRKEIAGLPPTARGGAEVYSSGFSDATYAEVLRRATEATACGAPVVVLDGNFATPSRRAEAVRAAAVAGADLRVAVVEVDEATALGRAAERGDDPQDASDADPEVTAELRARFIAPREDEGRPIVTVDGSLTVEEMCREALVGLLDGCLG